jgi:hypothetical protein
MELNNTIILPGDNPVLAKSLLDSLIEKEDVVIVIIFGNNQNAIEAVKKADVRAKAIVSGISRKVAWMLDPSLISYLKTKLSPNSVLDPNNIDVSKHIGVAVSMTDVLKDLIDIIPNPDFIRMEMAFLKASTI